MSLFWNLRDFLAERRGAFLAALERPRAAASDFCRAVEATEELWATLEQTYPNKVFVGNGAPVIHLKGQVDDLAALRSRASDAALARSPLKRLISQALHHRSFQEIGKTCP